MSLINEQAIFLRQMCDLIDYAEQHYATTGGELERTQAQHDANVKAGRSKATRSRHMDRCAIDLHFYQLNDGKFIEVIDKARLQNLGNYWKSLDPKNRWGGDWKNPFDPWHFERGVV